MDLDMFQRWSCFKFNNLELAVDINLKIYTSFSKGLKLKLRKFWGLAPTCVEVTGEKLVGGLFASPRPILNRVKIGDTLVFFELCAINIYVAL